jgi:hypothetical protein
MRVPGRLISPKYDIVLSKLPKSNPWRVLLCIGDELRYMSIFNQPRKGTMHCTGQSQRMGLLERENLGEIGLYSYEKSVSSVYGYVSILHLL